MSSDEREAQFNNTGDPALDALREVLPEVADFLAGAKRIDRDPYETIVSIDGPAVAWFRGLLEHVRDEDRIMFVIDGGVRMSRNGGPWTAPVGRIEP